MIPMLVMTGRVDNVFLTPEKEGKDGKYGGDYKVQLLVDQPQENGEVKRGLVDLKTQYPVYFQALEGHQVSVPVGVYVYKGNPGFFILKSWRPGVNSSQSPSGAFGGDVEAKAS